MPGQKPDYKFIVKNETTGSWESYIAAWKREDGSYSLQVNIPGLEPFKGLLVDGLKQFAAKPKEEPKTVDEVMKDDSIPF